MITMALAKGRLAEKTMELLERCGIECKEVLADTRKLIFYDERSDVRSERIKDDYERNTCG